jgi:hypothetical protein
MSHTARLIHILFWNLLINSLFDASFTLTTALFIFLLRFGCIALSMHPGTTDTDLSVPFQKNVIPEKLFPVEYSVEKMLDVIWNAGGKDSGKFFAYDGSEIEW